MTQIGGRERSWRIVLFGSLASTVPLLYASMRSQEARTRGVHGTAAPGSARSARASERDGAEASASAVYRAIVDVHAVLVREGRVLLSRRATGYGAGLWHMPSGKLEPGESVVQAVIREAREEVGVALEPREMRCAHVLHVRPAGQEPRIGFFFEATEWRGEPANLEPDKCSELAWFAVGELPADMVPYPAVGLAAVLAGEPFGASGWDEPDDDPSAGARFTAVPAARQGENRGV